MADRPDACRVGSGVMEFLGDGIRGCNLLRRISEVEGNVFNVLGGASLWTMSLGVAPGLFYFVEVSGR